MRATEKIKKPSILFYGFFELTEGTQKTPTYELTKCVGAYAPFAVKPIYNVRKKNVTLYLGRAINDNPNAPAMRIYKSSLNVTGLKDLFHKGGLTGYAYGYPPTTQYYGEKATSLNPFYNYRTDAFLFVIHYGKQRGKRDTTPRTIEILVLEGARVLIPLYAKQLQIGGFDTDLEGLRKSATAPDSATAKKPGDLF